MYKKSCKLEECLYLFWSVLGIVEAVLSSIITIVIEFGLKLISWVNRIGNY